MSISEPLAISENLTPTAARIFDSLPAYFLGEPTLTRIVQVLANEFDRVQAFLVAVQNGLVPLLADDEFHMLGIWEAVLGLPVEPTVNISIRQQTIRAALLRRFVMRAVDWEADMSAILGTDAWSHQEGVPAPGIMTLTLPYEPSTYVGGLVLLFWRQITPANYQLNLVYQGHWIVGISKVGDVI